MSKTFPPRLNGLRFDMHDGNGPKWIATETEMPNTVESVFISWDEHLALSAEAVRALEFIAGGCLVPPDGGTPRLEDAIAEAKQALAKLKAPDSGARGEK